MFTVHPRPLVNVLIYAYCHLKEIAKARHFKTSEQTASCERPSDNTSAGRQRGRGESTSVIPFILPIILD